MTNREALALQKTLTRVDAVRQALATLPWGPPEATLAALDNLRTTIADEFGVVSESMEATEEEIDAAEHDLGQLIDADTAYDGDDASALWLETAEAFLGDIEGAI